MIMPNYVSSVAIRYRVKSTYKPSGTAGCSVSCFLSHEVTWNFSTPPTPPPPVPNYTLALALFIQTLNSTIPLINRYPVAK